MGDDGMSTPQLECATISSSGELLAVGSGETGAVALWGPFRDSLGRANRETSSSPLLGRPNHDRQSLKVTGTDASEPYGFLPKKRPYVATPPPLSLVLDSHAPVAHYTIKSHALAPEVDATFVEENLVSYIASATANHRGYCGFEDHKLLSRTQLSLHPALLSGMQPTISESGLPVGTLQLSSLLPHRYQPYTENTPDPRGMYFGALRESVWLNLDPRKGEERAANVARQQRDMLHILAGETGADARDGKSALSHSTESNSANPFVPLIREKFFPYLAAKDVVGKYGFVDEVQYALRNSTAHSGLENLQSHPNAAYSNAFVQVSF
jgi:hypothetical protein